MERPNEQYWKILYIDDDEDDYFLAREMLSKAQGRKIDLDWVDSFEKGWEKLSQWFDSRDQSACYDAVLIDYDLGNRTGIEIIAQFSAQYPAPLILYTGRGSYDVDLEAMQAGAALYITKSDVNSLTLERFIRYAIETKRVKLDLDQNMRQKAAILESIQDGLIGIGWDWRITYVNQRATEITGQEPAHVIGKNVWEIFPRLVGTIVEKKYREVMETRSAVQFDATGVYSGIWYSLAVFPSSDGISIYWQDITAQKQIQERLKYHSMLLENIHDAVIALDADLNITLWNRAAERVSGVSEQEALGKKFYQLVQRQGVTLEEREADREKLIRDGSLHTEYAFIKQNGQVVIMDSTNLVLRGPSGEITGYLVTSRDITQRIQDEADLRATEEKFAKAFQASPFALAITRLSDGKFIEVNDNHEQLSGYTRDEVIGRSSTGLNLYVNPEDRVQIVKIMREQGFVRNYELQVRMKSGEVRTQLFSLDPIMLQNEPCILSTAVDITERKQAEEALRRSEERYSDLIKTAPSPIYEINFRTRRFTVVNDEMIRVLGYTREELLQMDPLDFMDEESRAKFQERTQKWLSGEKPAENVEYRIRAKDGHIIYAILRATFTNDSSGRPLGATVVGHDITERKRMEEALRLSEEKFARSFRSSPVALAISTIADGRFLEVNDSYLNLFQYSRDELIGRTSIELGMFPDSAKRQEIVELVRSDRGLQNYELRLLTKHGQVRDVFFSTERIEIDGQDCMLSLVVDITERKRAEKELQNAIERERQRSAELETLMDTFPALIWIAHDRECQEMTANRYGYEFLRMWQGANISKSASDEDVILQPYRNFKGGREIPTSELPMQVAARTGQPISNYDFDLVFSDGTRRTVLGNVNPVLDSEGKPNGAVAVFIDITDRKQAEKEMQRYAEELERSNQALKDFTFIASHDLQEPLRKVQAFGHMLSTRFSAELGEEGEDYIARITSAASRMSLMLSGLLTYSRITTQGNPFTDVDIKNVAQEVISDLEARLHETGGHIELGDLPVIQADPLQMRQLLQNLVGNALKYHRTGVKPLVTLSSRPLSGEQVELEVQDNGVGFDMNQVNSLFEPFVRLHSRSEFEGSGMGLAICKKIAERHGGTIAAESIPGRGSTFIVTLPVRQNKE